MDEITSNRGRLRQVSYWFALPATVMGFTVLLGWIFNDPILKGSLADGITVKANMGVGLLLAGCASLLHHLTPVSASAKRIAKACAAVVFMLGAATSSQHIFGWNLGIDQILFTEPAGQAATASPNRMGPPGSSCLMLAGLAILLLSHRGRIAQNAGSVLGLLVAAISLLSVVGYVSGARELYGLARYTGIALPTALALLMLGFSIALSARGSVLVAQLTSKTAGGVLLRRLMLPALILPLVFGVLTALGQEAGLFDAPFGRSCLILASVLIFAGLVWASSRELDAIDRERLHLLSSERSARSEAEQANRLKDEFFATLSHELRTPLNAILGWAQLLRRADPRMLEFSKGLDTIERNAKLQAQLIEDLLDTSRALSGKLRLNIERINPSSIARAALESIRPLAAAKQISISSDIQPTLPEINGDPDRLQQIFWNLLTNAVKFTPPGGAIKVRLRQSQNFVEAQVTDTGQGIKPDFVGRLFERFVQADGSVSRRHGGLGIGLSIARDLVNLHGGEISASSPGIGYGATFTIRLPIPSELVKVASHIRATRSEPALNFSFESLRILIVEDDPDSREMIGRLLKHHGAQVTLASSSADAIRAVDKSKPDIIVSDIGMPDQDGYEMLKAILRFHGDIAAVAVTAFARPEDQAKALRAGFQYHLRKPLEPVQLLTVISRIAAAKVERAAKSA
ncbi:MAG: response regulator [Deltaproteobacteria bacterium]|nr:response regulator [Deltaproteobacteria bacterium]